MHNLLLTMSCVEFLLNDVTQCLSADVDNCNETCITVHLVHVHMPQNIITTHTSAETTVLTLSCVRVITLILARRLGLPSQCPNTDWIWSGFAVSIEWAQTGI